MPRAPLTGGTSRALRAYRAAFDPSLATLEASEGVSVGFGHPRASQGSAGVGAAPATRVGRRRRRRGRSASFPPCHSRTPLSVSLSAPPYFHPSCRAVCYTHTACARLTFTQQLNVEFVASVSQSRDVQVPLMHHTCGIRLDFRTHRRRRRWHQSWHSSTVSCTCRHTHTVTDQKREYTSLRGLWLDLFLLRHIVHTCGRSTRRSSTDRRASPEATEGRSGWSPSPHGPCPPAPAWSSSRWCQSRAPFLASWNRKYEVAITNKTPYCH